MAGIDTTQIVVAAISGIFLLASGLGFWQWLQHRQEEPIRQKDSDIANAHIASEMALAVAAANADSASASRLDNRTLRADLDQLRADLKAETERGEALEKRLNDQAQTVRRLSDIARVFNHWIENVITNWEELRVLEIPPNRPPVNLADLDELGK